MTGYTPIYIRKPSLVEGMGDNSKGLEQHLQRRMSLGMKIGIGVARLRESILYDTAKFG